MICLARIVSVGVFVASLAGSGLAAANKVVGSPGAASAAIPSERIVTAAEPEESDDSLAPEVKSAPDATPAPAPTRQQKLDDLFARLAASTDAAETQGLIAAIDRLHLESGSDTGDFLMARAVAALGSQNLPVSRALLDKLIALQPDWAEAWNKRATVRYLMDDEKGSMADIARVLVLEPRHFGALSGMGMILERGGFSDEALRAYRRALEIAPQLASLRAAVDRLTAAIKGQSL
jgi:tetratricopeptide (TPR) repeat protein